jgi:delta 1-pyrroline-5-carboxylate dehydrogenase
MRAASRGDEGVVRLLLENGADASLKNKVRDAMSCAPRV